MCPLCLSALSWVALGGCSTASLAALVIAFGKGAEDGDDREDDSSDHNA